VDHPVVIALLGRVADLVAERCRSGTNGHGGGAYYTSTDNPLKSARAFRDAARRGEFESFKLGRLIAAKQADVHAWIESGAVAPKLAKTEPREVMAPTDQTPAEFGLRATRRST
jgi:hypothetical protein